MHAKGAGTQGESHVDAAQEFATRLRADFLTYLPARLIPATVGLATVFLFTRLFSPEEYGVYALVLAAGGISLTLLVGWIRECAIRFLPEEQAEPRRDMFMLGLLLLAVGVALLPMVGMAAAYVSGAVPLTYRALLPWAALWVALSVVYGTLSGLLQAGLRAGRYARWEAVRSVLGLGMAAGYVLLVHRSVAGAFVGLALAALVTAGGIARDLSLTSRVARFRKTRRSLDHGALLGLVVYGLPLVGWTAGREILNMGDRFVIQWFWGSEAVGIYASNYFLADGGAGLLLLPLLAATAPLAIHAWARDGAERTQGLVTLSTRMLLLVLLPCLAALSVLAPHLARLLLAPGYREGFVVMPLVLAGDGLWALGQLGQKGFLLARRTTIMLVGVLLCAMVNVVLNIILVPRWGYTAAAVTTVISYGLYPVFTFLGTRELLRWNFPWRTLFLGGLAALCAGAVLWFGWEVWSGAWFMRAACSLAAPVVYLAVLVTTGETGRGELLAIAHAVRRAGRRGGR